MTDIQCRCVEQTPTEVTYIENHWRHLQPHVREAIMTLVDGALTAGVVRVDTKGRTDDQCIPIPEECSQ